MPRLILASGSPRRKELLGMLGIDFTIVVSNVDEDQLVAEANPKLPEEIVMLLASAKAQAVASEIDDDVVVIGADTIVWLDGAALNKPRDTDHAVEMLMALSGRVHEVYTGIAIVTKSSDNNVNVMTDFERTEVEFHAFTIDEARDYVATGEPRDKAGAYGIQDIGKKLVKSVKGDFYNVVGLPVVLIRKHLIAFYDDLASPH